MVNWNQFRGETPLSGRIALREGFFERPRTIHSMGVGNIVPYRFDGEAK
jgi:hypothetical protein